MKRMMLWGALALLMALRTIAQAQAQPVEIGAQVWVEPGHTPQQIDRWFQTLAEQNMPVARLFLIWSFMEPRQGQWDFTLYDQCFDAAQRHRVKIVATLMTNWGPTWQGYNYRVQDGAIAQTEEQLKTQEIAIKAIVSHFAGHPALDTWMLMNEPGQNFSPDPLALSRFRSFLKTKYTTIEALNKAWLSGHASFEAIEYSDKWPSGWSWPGAFVDWRFFWREHLNWYLAWVAERVRLHDKQHDLHVNPHALLDITSRYDLPGMRTFLNSLGASIHPVWHFNILSRAQYTTGVSLVSDMVRGASEPKPFWVTELQGGHNVFSADKNLRPSSDELVRWVWTSVGAGARRTIFWCLNPRENGTEAAEWSMIDFNDRPTDRLRAVAEIGKTLKEHSELFDKAQVSAPPVYILLSPETMIIQEKKPVPDSPWGRGPYAHKYEAMGFYHTLQERGINAQIKNLDDFDFEAKGPKRIAILPHAMALSANYWPRLQAFVRNGGLLIITGLTGLFDETETRQYKPGCPLYDLTGASVTEISGAPATDPAYLNLGEDRLPWHHFQAQLRLEDKSEGTQVLGRKGSEVLGTCRKIGQGEVLYIPALIGTSAWHHSNTELGTWLDKVCAPYLENEYFTFVRPKAQVICRTLASEKGYVTVLVNTSGVKGLPTPLNIEFRRVPPGYKPNLLYGSTQLMPGSRTITVPAGKVVVIAWEK